MMPSSILNSDHVNKPLILLILAINQFLQAFLFCFVQYFALTIITLICYITMRRLINEYLAEFINKEALLRLEKPNDSTHLESFTLNKLMQVKLSLKLNLCFFKKFVAFRLSKPLSQAFKEVNCIKLLVYTKVLYQS